MTSLFSRLQKLNKEATPPEWGFQDEESAATLIAKKPGSYMYLADSDGYMDVQNARLVVECRNSLPAVLNLIEAVKESRWWATEWASTGSPYAREQMAAANVRVDEALAVFVSGQEEAP